MLIISPSPPKNNLKTKFKWVVTFSHVWKTKLNGKQKLDEKQKLDGQQILDGKQKG